METSRVCNNACRRRPVGARVSGAIHSMDLRALGAVALDHPDTTQLFLFGALLLGMWLTEHAVGARPMAEKLRHASTNITFLLGVLPVQLSMMAGCLWAMRWSELHHFGLVYLLPY